MGYTPHSLQAKILASSARFRLVVAGRRWGKSLSAAWEALTEAVLGGRVWVVGLTYEQTDRILEPIWSFLARNPCFVADGTRRSERRIVLQGGGFIVGKSADHADSLVGESLTLAILDEAPIMPERIWQQMIRPCLSDRRGRAVMIGTPRGHNWVWDKFNRSCRDDDATGDPEWYAWRAPSWTNDVKFPKGVDDPEIKSIRDDAEACGMLPLFDQEYAASFTAMQGRVYSKWDASRMVVGPSSAMAGVQEVIGGVDWGFNHPAAIVVAGRTGDGAWHVLDEWVERGKVLDEVVAAMHRLATTWRVKRWWCDPSQPGMIATCQRAGLDAGPAYNDVQPGVMKIAQLMARPGGFLVSSKCRKLISELDCYVWRDSTHKDEPVKQNDDAADSLRYCVSTEEHIGTRVTRSTRIQGL
jgi:hypothetical protein